MDITVPAIIMLVAAIYGCIVTKLMFRKLDINSPEIESIAIGDYINFMPDDDNILIGIGVVLSKSKYDCRVGCVDKFGTKRDITVRYSDIMF